MSPIASVKRLVDRYDQSIAIRESNSGYRVTDKSGGNLAMQPQITPIQPHDPRVSAAITTERDLFDHYGLSYTAHSIPIAEPNLRVRVLEVGSGPPVLIIPGGSGEAWQFAPLMAALKHWRFIVLNRPGGGLSDAIDHRQIDIRRFAVTTLLKVLDAFQLDQVPVIGNSMGGLWAFWLALDAPARVSRIVQLGCPALILNTSAPAMMRLLAVPGLNHLVVSTMQPKNPDAALDGLRFQGSRPEVIAALPRELGAAAYAFFNLPTYRDTWRTMSAATMTLRGARRHYQLRADHLRHIPHSVQFIWGDADPFGDRNTARRAANLLPHAQLHEVQAGHLPHIDQAAVCANVIRKFFVAA
jgi:2-hydroxy-6-oxonona-2,4-dienedioate hydrolase